MDTINTELTYGRMLRLARRMVTDDADDTAHDAWLLTQTRTDPEPADAYLRTAIRWARDMRWRTDARRRERERVVGSNDGDNARVELIVAVIEALDTLSPTDREIVWRRHVDGRSPDEIAELTGLRADAVRQRVLRALRSLRQRLDRDYGGRGAWAAIAITIDGTSIPSVPLAVQGASRAIVLPTGVLIGTVGGLAIAWGMSCTMYHARGSTGAADIDDPEPITEGIPAIAPDPMPPATVASPAGPSPSRRTPVPADRSNLLAGGYAKRFDADTHRRFRGEVNASFTECVREWNQGAKGEARPMSGRTVFIVELDVVSDDRVDVDDVWVEEDTATMREVVECMQHGLETVSLDTIVGTLPSQMRVVLDGDQHSAFAKPVIDLDGLPEDLLDDREFIEHLGGWIMGKQEVPPAATAAVVQFAEAFADGRIAPGELDDATLAGLRAAR